MLMTSRSSRPVGFSLIEVLIAVVVMSFGLLALSALQGSLFRNSAESKAQSVGLALASEKLEFFRGYRDSATYRALTTGEDATTATPLVVGGIAYTRDWVITRYAYPSAGGDFVNVANTAPLGAGYVDNNEFKRIVVTVGWTDATGAAQKVVLEDALAAIDPGDSRKIAKSAGTARPRGPEVRIYTPTSQQEGVIPIAIGDGTDTAATNPKPLINAGNVIETRFDILTYSGLSGNTAISQSRIQTSVAACQCDTATADAEDIPKRPTYWNGVGYVVPENATYASMAGEATNATTQSDLCSMCCRDHHDPVGIAASEARFDPRNSSHVTAHRLLNVTTGALTESNGLYSEVCRVIRVGGFFRVAADTYNDYMNVLDTNSSVPNPDSGKAVYVPTAAATTNYQNFVKAYLAARVVDQTSETAFNTVLASNIDATSTLEATHALNDVDQSISVQGAKAYGVNELPKWLHARGLYIDFLESEAVQAVKDAKDNCKGTGASAPTALQIQDCVLKVLPFTSINLTELAKWTPATGTQIVVASNNFATTVSSTEPIRGKVTRGSSPTANQTTNAVATARRSNSGLTTLIGGIDTDDASSAPPATWTAVQPFTIQGTASVGGTFGVRLAVNGAAYPYMENTITPYIMSSLSGVACNPPQGGTHPCTSASTLGSAQTLTLGNYNYEKRGTSTTPLTCSNGTTQVTWSGPYNIKICRNYAVTGVTLSPGTGSASVPFTVTSEGLKRESTAVQLSSVTNSDVIVVTFGAPTETVQPLTCSYSCKNKSCTQKLYSAESPDCP